MTLIIDMSGHPELVEKGANLWILNPQYDTESASRLSSDVEKQFLTMMEEMTPAQRKIIKSGKFILVLPGLFAATATMLAIVHGIAGHFPKILWSTRCDDGFKLIDNALPLQSIREAMRSRRFDF